MTKLVLRPSLENFNREELEAYISDLQLKRMSAAVEYHANANAKIGHEIDKIQNKFFAKVERLGKLILKLDEAYERVVKQLQDIDLMKQEVGILTERIVDPSEVGAEDDED